MKNLYFILIILLPFFLANCRSQEPIIPKLYHPEVAFAPEDPTPDVIKLAIYFIEREGMRRLLLVEKAQILSQDFEAYYVIFPRKDISDSLIVKVYKRNGWTEWFLN